MKIHIEVEAEECPYWNYETHEPGHTCNDCECACNGNSIRYAHYGIMIGLDRYCMLNSKIYPEILRSVAEVR